jgi:PAS domain S-box-containing protein
MTDRRPRGERLPAERTSVERRTQWLAVLAASAVLAGVLGWLLQLPRLVQPTHVFAPARPWMFLVVLVAALAVWALGAGRILLARVAASATVLLCLIGTMANAASVALPLDAAASTRFLNGDAVRPQYGMSLSSALMYLAIAGATWLAARARPIGRRALPVATIGAVVFTIAGALGVAQLAGLLESGNARAWAQAPIQSLLGALLLALALLQYAVAFNRVALAPPRWFPAAMGLATGAVALMLWRGLTVQESEETSARARIASDAVQRAIDRQFGSIESAVRRLALFTANASPGTELFGESVSRLVTETVGLERLLLMSADGRVVRSAPRDSGGFSASPQLRAQTQSLLASYATPHALASLNTEVPIRVVGLTDAPWGIALIQATHNGRDGALAVVALIDERSLIGEFTADTSAGFAIRAFVADSQIFGTPRSRAAPAWTSRMHFGGRAIDLTLTPQPVARPAAMPDLVLVLGLAIAALLALTLWLARQTYEEASAVGMTRMQQAIERATDGVWELDVLTDRTYRSDALLRYLGLDPASVNGSATAWTERIHGDDAAMVSAAREAHLRGLTDAFECEYRVRAGDGVWHTIVERGRVVERMSDGRPRRMLGISADTTERARADSAREESERRFRAMFDTAYQLQLLLDLDGSVLEANRAAAELAGTTVDALQGQIFSALPWWSDDAGVRVQDRVARARNGDSSRFEVELTGAGDRRAIVDFSLKPLLDQEQRVVQVLAEGRDLTERKRAEASLREIGTLTTMGQLAARVAHEINNPLAGIQNAFLLVRGSIPTDHPHYRFVGAIEREIARIAAVTRQLYETYRPDQTLERGASVILAISDAVTFLEQVNRSRDVRIVTDVARAPSVVPVPDALLRQTLYNLVQNAFDASPSGGTITVSATHDDGWCIIRVSDDGPGIPEELQRRIFDPFFSTKDRSVKTGGMGIGLSLVHQSVTAVGGQIDVHNRSSGGSLFEVRLPMTPIDTGVLR